MSFLWLNQQCQSTEQKSQQPVKINHWCLPLLIHQLTPKAALTTETKQRKTIPKQNQNKTKTICFGFVSVLHTCETKR